MEFYWFPINVQEPGQRSLYRDCLWAGVQATVMSKNFLSSSSSRPAVRPTQPPIQWVPGALSLGVKRPGREGDRSPPVVPRSRKCGLYIHSPILPHDVLFNLINTGTALPYLYLLGRFLVYRKQVALNNLIKS
jgi:hypothetical protein